MGFKDEKLGKILKAKAREEEERCGERLRTFASMAWTVQKQFGIHFPFILSMMKFIYVMSCD